ncbi:hypothetical protein LAV72_18200 [Lysinibacillus xylanilyticus]|nr:hypothetical protein [Lysinibacillus xylanilyticus]MEB2301540.1 hypothetical protein [Lysinibacillus xylanilyticus]
MRIKKFALTVFIIIGCIMSFLFIEKIEKVEVAPADEIYLDCGLTV